MTNLAKKIHLTEKFESNDLRRGNRAKNADLRSLVGMNSRRAFRILNSRVKLLRCRHVTQDGRRF